MLSNGDGGHAREGGCFQNGPAERVQRCEPGSDLVDRHHSPSVAVRALHHPVGRLLKVQVPEVVRP